MQTSPKQVLVAVALIGAGVALLVCERIPANGPESGEAPVFSSTPPPAPPKPKREEKPRRRGGSPTWDVSTWLGRSWHGTPETYGDDVAILEQMSTKHGAVYHFARDASDGRHRSKLMMSVGDYDGMNGMVRLFDDETPEGLAQPNVGVQLHPKGDSFFVGGDVGIGTTEPTTRLDVDSDAIRVRRPRTVGSLGSGEQGEIVWARDDDGSHYIYVNVDGKQWKGVELTLSEPATR